MAAPGSYTGPQRLARDPRPVGPATAQPGSPWTRSWPSSCGSVSEELTEVRYAWDTSRDLSRFAPDLGCRAMSRTHRRLGALRDTGYRSRSVKTEIRENLLDRLRSGETAFPGIVGFDDTVLPQLESALLAGHDLVLLGERGQGKTRLMRTIGTLLDEWTPVVEGCEINDDPLAPVCARCRRLAAETGDDLPVAWRHRSERYVEKLATPDTSVGDLVGDVDPVKVAEGRTLGDPETVHYGLLPRTNRGVFGINELPDLAERIQVAMFNVLEERDIQVRGYSLRLPDRRPAGGQRQPGGLHQPRAHHHPAQGPLRRRAAHALPRARSPRRSRWSPRRPRWSPTCPSTCSRSWPG